MVQKDKKSFFACDKTEVYGDVEVAGLVKKVEDTENEFHFAKRKQMGTWINIRMYKQVWTINVSRFRWKMLRKNSTLPKGR